MGFVKGATIEVVREAPLFDPMELKIHNYHISLRKSEAKLIEVETL
jgi:ferrous iron transport protein A